MARNQAIFDQPYGRLAGASITGSYQTLINIARGSGFLAAESATILLFFNTLDKDIIVSLNGGVTDWGYIPALANWTLDLTAGDMLFTGVVQVKHAGVAPTTGAISVSAVRTREQ